MKKKIVLVLTCAVMLTLTACGKTNNDSKADGNQADLKISMVTDTGGVNDQSFNQSCWEGLEEFGQKTGTKVNYVESTQEADYASNLDKMVDGNADLIWGVGFSIADALYQSASMNPDQLFGIIDHSYGEDTLDNIASIMFRAQESSFLVGYAAGLTTITNEVGFIGGISSDILDQFEYGFRAGVEYAARERGTDIKVSTQYVESFVDAARGKAIATKMYTAGCDVIFQAAGGAGKGVIEAAIEFDKYVIGVDRDQLEFAPNNVLTSALKIVGKAVQLVCESVKNGENVGGHNYVYGLAEDAIGIPENNPNMAPEVYEATMNVKQLIVDGKIDVPYNQETLEAFLAE